jgi:hypothetical protein
MSLKTREITVSEEELNGVFRAGYYKPERLVELFERDFADEFSKSVGVWEGYTLKEHTLMVLRQFEKYFSEQRLPADIDRNFLRVVLTLHDIGKPRAVEEGDKKKQHQYTTVLIKPILKKLGFSEEKIAIAVALISSDPIGEYIKRGDLQEVVREIRTKANHISLPESEFLDLLLLYYAVDASSYTKDAGGFESLDYLFLFLILETGS